MSIHRVDSNPTFVTEVTVRESDKYSQAVYIKFDRHYVPEEIRGVDEMFMSVDELEDMAKFFIAEADKIRSAQMKRQRG